MKSVTLSLFLAFSLLGINALHGQGATEDLVDFGKFRLKKPISKNLDGSFLGGTADTSVTIRVPLATQRQTVLADPSSIDALIEGASPAEAAAVLAAVLKELDGQNLTPEQKRDFIALLVARVTHVLPKKIEFTMELIARVDDQWVDVVIAAAYSATGLDVEFKKALVGKSPKAIGDPEATLGLLLYTRILGSTGLNPTSPLNLLLPPPLTDGVVDSAPPAAKKYQN
jgi:hypothetical protein